MNGRSSFVLTLNLGKEAWFRKDGWTLQFDTTYKEPSKQAEVTETEDLGESPLKFMEELGTYLIAAVAFDRPENSFTVVVLQ